MGGAGTGGNMGGGVTLHTNKQRRDREKEKVCVLEHN